MDYESFNITLNCSSTCGIMITFFHLSVEILKSGNDMDVVD